MTVGVQFVALSGNTLRHHPNKLFNRKIICRY
jgi:hypothetical protein